MKTLRNIYTATWAAAALLFTGCYSTSTDDDVLATGTRMNSYPETVEVPDIVSTQQVVITVNPRAKRNLNWDCSVGAVTWVKAVKQRVAGESTGDVKENGVVLTFEENTAYSRRTTLTITASDGTVLEVPVVQKGVFADAEVSLSPAALTFMAENPGTKNFTVTTNMDEVAVTSDADWCTVQKNGDGTVTVGCTEWDDLNSERTATVTVTVGTPETSQAEATLAVTQLRKDVYCYLYGSATPKFAAQVSASQMTKLSDGIYADSVYVKNGNIAVYTTDKQAYFLSSDGTLSDAETSLTVDVAGLRAITLNLKEKTYSIDRITTTNCLPDANADDYATATYTANGRTKVWMRSALNWNGGDGIGALKLGSRMVSDANNVGGYSANLSELTTVRVSDYDEVESGGKAQGEVDMTNEYGRIYSLTEFLTGTPKGALEITRLLTDWPEPYHPGTTFVDAIGNDIPMVGLKTLDGVDAKAPTLSMQIQGICPYGWHVANVEDFYDMLCAASEAKGIAPVELSSMVGAWSVPDMLRSTEGWTSTPTRNAKADEFGFNLFPQGRRLFKAGYQNYGIYCEMFICHPGGLSGGVYQSWRINAVKNSAATLTISTGYNIGDCSASFRCVKNYENY